MTSLLKKTLVLMATAGLAASVTAQSTNNNDRDRQNERQTQAERDAQLRRPTQPGHSQDQIREQSGLRVLDVHQAGDVIGADVVNPQGDTVGSIEDIIVDRGNGRIDFMIIKSGDILGIGGRNIAVPYEAFTFNEQENKFSINATEDSLTDRAKRHDDWVVFGGDADSDAKDVDTWLGAYRGNDGLEKRWGERLKSADTSAVSGVITAIRHESNMAGGDCVIIDVRTRQGRDMSIALGPSWYVMGSAASPERGDEIIANVVERTPEWDDSDQINTPDHDPHRPAVRDPAARPGTEGQVNRPGQPVEQRENQRPGGSQPGDMDDDMEGNQPQRWNSAHADAVALEARIDGQQLKLWDKDARSTWMRDDARSGYHQFVRLSKVIGSDVQASTQPKTFDRDDVNPGHDADGKRTPAVIGSDYADAGDVQGAVIERLSGTVPALVIDPDENFLGIGDTLRLVPWNVVRVGTQDDTVILDADKEMLTSCREMPDDVADLGTREAMAAIYVPFRMEPNTLHRRTSESAHYQPRESDRP